MSDIRGKCGDCAWKSLGHFPDQTIHDYCIGSPDYYSEDKSLIPKSRIVANPYGDGTNTLVTDDDLCMDLKPWGWGFKGNAQYEFENRIPR